MSDFPRTRQLLEEGIRERLHLGAQLYVSSGGVTCADFAVGENRPGIALTPESVTLWFSSGKPVTAIAVAQQYQQGRLGWDDLVTAHVPEFGQQGKELITVRHLLTHMGGFRTADPVPYDGDWEQAVQHVCASPLEPAWIPGEKAGYHYTSSWVILAEIVQRLTARPFAQYVQEQVFRPLGMKECWMTMPPQQYRAYGDDLGWMYLTEKGELRSHDYWNSEAGCAQMRPGGNVRGPIRALGSFYEALLQARGAQAEAVLENWQLKPATLTALTQPQRVGFYDHTFQHLVDWGLGFIIDSNRYGAETVPYGYGRRSSAETFGHSGAQSSCAFADPARQLVVAWVCNGMPGERKHQRRARELNTAIYQDLVGVIKSG